MANADRLRLWVGELAKRYNYNNPIKNIIFLSTKAHRIVTVDGVIGLGLRNIQKNINKS